MAKGSEHERRVCWELSRWWCGHKRSLVFWRTSNSGGGATVRHRKGISNKSHSGDITAIESTGLPFTELVTVEVKAGYTEKRGKKKQTANVHDLLDRVKQHAMYEDWILQSRKAAERAGSRYWMLVHHRDHRKTMCYFPSRLYAELATVGCFPKLPVPFAALTVRVRDGKRVEVVSVVGMEFNRFLFCVDPDDVRAIVGG